VDLLLSQDDPAPGNWLGACNQCLTRNRDAGIENCRGGGRRLDRKLESERASEFRYQELAAGRVTYRASPATHSLCG